MSRTRSNLSGSLALALAFAIFLTGLMVAVWRQSVTLETLEELYHVRREHAALRAEHATKQRELQRQESRAVIVRRAREELDMRIPAPEALILLPHPDSEP